MDPFFEVATEDEAQRLYQRVFLRWLQEKLDDPAPGIRRLLREPVDRDVGPVDRLKQAGWSLIERRDFPTPWEIRPFAREEEIDWVTEKFLKIAKLSEDCVNPKDTLYLDLASSRSFAIELDRQETASGERDYDYLEHRLPKIDLGKRKGRGAFSDRASRQEILDERDGLVESLKDFRKRAAPIEPLIYIASFPELVERYREIKTKAADSTSWIFSSKLEISFVTTHPSEKSCRIASLTFSLTSSRTPTPCRPRSSSCSLPMIPAWMIGIACDRGEESFSRSRTRSNRSIDFVVPTCPFTNRSSDASSIAGRNGVFLSVSFRSLPEIQEMVNTVMSEVMTGSEETHQASYVSLDQFREPIVANPLSSPYRFHGRTVRMEGGQLRDREVGTARRSRLGQVLIEESNWKVTSRDRPEPHEIRPSDICLLFRRFQSGGRDITRPYVDGLQARDVAHVLVVAAAFTSARRSMPCEVLWPPWSGRTASWRSFPRFEAPSSARGRCPSSLSDPSWHVAPLPRATRRPHGIRHGGRLGA